MVRIVREFSFELRVCAHLERDAIVARQLGSGVHRPANRVVDVVCVDPGPDFEERAAITPATIPGPAIEADVGVGRARYWKDAFSGLDLSSDRARAIVEHAIDIGFFERERRGGRTYIRQAVRYPDWFGRLRAIENKPDLDTPGDLETQLRTDVSLGLVDEVILATTSYVTGAHLNRLPDEVGVWRVYPTRNEQRSEPGAARDDAVEIEVVREPTPLPVDEAGIERIDARPSRTDIRSVTPDAKARRRRELAERAYGKGWRTYDFPACSRIESATNAGTGGLPYCSWHDRIVYPATECGQACPGHEPGEPPVVDTCAERDRRSPWIAVPEGRVRRQSGLDRF